MSTVTEFLDNISGHQNLSSVQNAAARYIADALAEVANINQKHSRNQTVNNNQQKLQFEPFEKQVRSTVSVSVRE